MHNYSAVSRRREYPRPFVVTSGLMIDIGSTGIHYIAYLPKIQTVG
jgi:hypothetical protein